MKKFTIFAVTVITALSLAAQNRELTLDDVIGGTFYGSGAPSITPMADGEHYLASKGNYILQYSFKTGAVTDTTCLRTFHTLSYRRCDTA